MRNFQVSRRVPNHVGTLRVFLSLWRGGVRLRDHRFFTLLPIDCVIAFVLSIDGCGSALSFGVVSRAVVPIRLPLGIRI